MPIQQRIRAYVGGLRGACDREYAWVDCYRYFHDHTVDYIANHREDAALHFGFYLASWGMHRGKAFLRNYNYTVHRGVIDLFVQPEFQALRTREFGATDHDTDLVPLILTAVDGIREAYGPFGQASPTLVTKVLLGTFGCLPALDANFTDGWKFTHHRQPRPSLNFTFIEGVLAFCREHIQQFRAAQKSVIRIMGIRYPLMKLVDMYFFQKGIEGA